MFSVPTKKKSQSFHVSGLKNVLEKLRCHEGLSVDGGPNCRNKAPFSNFSGGVVWTNPIASGDNMVYCVPRENESDVRVIYLNRYPFYTLDSRCKIN